MYPSTATSTVTECHISVCRVWIRLLTVLELFFKYLNISNCAIWNLGSFLFLLINLNPKFYSKPTCSRSHSHTDAVLQQGITKSVSVCGV